MRADSAVEPTKSENISVSFGLRLIALQLVKSLQKNDYYDGESSIGRSLRVALHHKNSLTFSMFPDVAEKSMQHAA
jgi:hypothetical protein